MTDFNKLLGQFLNNGAATGLAGGVVGGLASGLLTGKSGKKLGKKALKVGGVAAVGALAYTAYKRYNNKQRTSSDEAATQGTELLSAPQDSAFLPDNADQAANNELGLTLIRAMIAASRADGQMDAQESQVIFQRIEELGLDDESRSFVIEEMSQPVNMDTIINSATSPEVAAEIYAASLLAIHVDNPAETAYLAMLAARLRLPADLVTEIEQQVEEQRQFV